MKAVLLLVLVVGCKFGSGPILVADVHIDGYDLVIERCELNSDSCETVRQRLPVTAIAPKWVPTAERERLHRRIGAARDALSSCAALEDLRGVVQVELVIDARGHASSAHVDRGSPAVATCVAEAFGETPFAVSAQTRIAFMFVAASAS